VSIRIFMNHRVPQDVYDTEQRQEDEGIKRADTDTLSAGTRDMIELL